MPARSSGLNLGGKTVKDLIGEDFRITVDGPYVTAYGDVKEIRDPWTEFDGSDNTGHFVPLLMPSVCGGKEITCGSRVKGDRTCRIDPDLLLVVRLENLETGVMTVAMDGESLMTADFTGVTEL